jgi:hypothetical protein
MFRRMILESDSIEDVGGLRYGRKACICDIRYLLVIYGLSIYSIPLHLDGFHFNTSPYVSSVTVG